MIRNRRVEHLLPTASLLIELCGVLVMSICIALPAEAEVPAELFKSAPAVDGELLLVGSADSSSHLGHLRAFDLYGIGDGPLWDAALLMPQPGIGTSPGNHVDSDPPLEPGADNLYRSLFTNLPGEKGLMPLAAQSAEVLQPLLGVANRAAAEALINLTRGRSGCNEENPAGTADGDHLLWGIRSSSPTVVGRSPVLETAEIRDRVAYVGATDGMLHAFHGGSWQEQGYLNNDPAAGVELWAYLPGSLLEFLKDQPFGETGRLPVVEVDSQPAVGDFFIDLDGDGIPHWHTLLAASAKVFTADRSSLFVLDVTDPYRPELVWEQLLSGDGMATTGGVCFGQSEAGQDGSAQLFLSTTRSSAAADSTSPGIGIMAIDLLSGATDWQFFSTYQGLPDAFTTAPPVPGLYDSDGDGRVDLVICGDHVGRLWGVAAADGTVYGDGPLFVTPGGAGEPIGAEVAMRGETIYFGTGGAPHADPNGQYGLYALSLSATGGELLWQQALPPGEQVWHAPLIDGAGNLLVGVAINYWGDAGPLANRTGGRLLAINASGELVASANKPAGLVAQTLVTNGLVLSVALTGDVSQYGTLQNGEEQSSNNIGSVKVLTWRQR